MMPKTSSVLPNSAFTRLEPPDFYLWGYLKDNVYENNPQTIGELKAAITAKIRETKQRHNTICVGHHDTQTSKYTG
jgi:hypothetical protein